MLKHNVAEHAASPPDRETGMVSIGFFCAHGIHSFRDDTLQFARQPASTRGND